MCARRLVGTYAGCVWLITLAGLAGRFLLLGAQPLWLDEPFNGVVVRRSVGTMLDAVRMDSAPPLAYLLEHAVTSFVSGPIGLRLVSVVAGAGAIPLGAALGRRIAGDRGGVFTALLCAVSPALVVSAGDARMYALAATLVMASTLLVIRAVEQPSVTRWGAYAAVTALALYTVYFVILAVVGQLAAVAVVLRAGRRAVVSAGLAVAIAGLTLVPWLIAARAQFAHTGSPFWIGSLSPQSVSGVFAPLMSGPPVDPGTPGKAVLQVLQGLALATAVPAGCALAALRHQLSDAGRRTALFCAVGSLGGVLLLFAISAVRSLTDARYASVAWGPMFAVAGAGLALVRPAVLRATGLAATALASIALCIGLVHPNTTAVVAALRSQLTAHDVVDATPSEYLLLDYYGDPALLSRTRILGPEPPWFFGTAAYPAGAVSPSVPADVIANRGAVYYVHGAGDPAAPVPAGYAARSTRCWGPSCLTVYSP